MMRPAPKCRMSEEGTDGRSGWGGRRVGAPASAGLGGGGDDAGGNAVAGDAVSGFRPDGCPDRRAGRTSRADDSGRRPPRRLLLSGGDLDRDLSRSEGNTSELQSLMRISYAVFCLKKKKHSITDKT